MEMKELSNNFINYINFDIRRKEDRLEGAIRTSMGAGNKKGSRVKPNEELKNALKECLDTMLAEVTNEKDLTQEKYDSVFYKTIENMEKDAREKDSECEFSFGRFQKIINIWIKYHVALSYSEDEKSDFSKYKKLLPFAHIPVDRIVITWFSKKENIKDKETRNAFKEIGSWKWKLTEASYKKIQQEAKKCCEAKGIKYPLELEMKEIWTKDK